MMDLLVMMEVLFYTPLSSRSFIVIPQGANSRGNSIIILLNDHMMAFLRFEGIFQVVPTLKLEKCPLVCLFFVEFGVQKSCKEYVMLQISTHLKQIQN